MSIAMRALKHVFVVLTAVVAVKADASEMTITNDCGEMVRVGVYSHSRRQWQMFAGTGPSVVLNNFKKVTLPNVLPGNYTITARSQRNVQGFERVVVHEGVNKFSVSVTPEAPMDPGPGAGGRAPRRPSGPRLSIFPEIDDPEKLVDDNQGGPAGAPAAPAPDEVSIPHIGISYTRVPYDNGTFGARLTRNPVPGSSATVVRLAPPGNELISLTEGDTIFEMDRQRFRSEDDVRNHRAYTTLRYVDGKTGQTRVGAFILP